MPNRFRSIAPASRMWQTENVMKNGAWGWWASVGMAMMLTLSAPRHAQAASRCSLDSSSGIAFGVYLANRAAPLDSVGFISYSCDDVVASDLITIEFSRSRGGSFFPRKMQGPGGAFEYNLYQDAARTVVWGDGTAGTGVYRARPPEHRTVQVPVYGRIGPGQVVERGQYIDVIVVTLLY